MRHLGLTPYKPEMALPGYTLLRPWGGPVFTSSTCGETCLNPSVGFQAEGNPPILQPAQVHDQPVAMSHGLGIPVKALQRHRVEEGVASAEVEKPVDRA